MESQTKLKLRYWIMGGYAIPILTLFISSIVTILSINTVNHRSQDLITSYGTKSTINDLSVNVQINARALRGYLLEKSPTSLGNYQKSLRSLSQALSKLKASFKTEQDQLSLAQIEDLMNQLNENNQQLIIKIDRGNIQEAIEFWKKNNGRTLVEQITDLIDGMQSREDRNVAIATKQQQEALNTLMLTILSASAISLLLSLLIGFWVIRCTSQQMSTSASTIVTSTSEIATAIEQQERAAIQQATSVNQTTTTMDELGASSRQSAEQARASATGAHEVLILVDGQTQDGRTNQSSLREKVGNIATQILHLSEQTHQIGMISTLVSDLASQTNMLALNAAVEAVRAGEHGKGFAVVAAEIRKLADESKTSAGKINALVVDIQNATNSTVMVTDEGTKTVEKIVDAMKIIAVNGQQIALTSNQQAIAVQQVVEAMNLINVNARETASGISQIKVGTKRLNEAANNLQNAV